MLKDKIIELLEKYDFFDSEYYINNNSDLSESSTDPLKHYIEYGLAENRVCNGWFDATWYKKFYEDLNHSNVNPQLHFLMHGVNENRFANENEYLINSFLKKHEVVQSEGLEVYLRQSKHLWIKEYSDFSINTYLKQLDIFYDTCREKFDESYYCDKVCHHLNIEVEPIVHYLIVGVLNGLDPAPWFDTKYYLDNNIDVAKASYEPFSHFLLFGEREGRKASSAASYSVKVDELNKEEANKPKSLWVSNFDSPVYKSFKDNFDADYYLKSNEDVRNSNCSAIEHYFNIGWKEGRNPCSWFNVKFYLSEYKDINNSELEPFCHYLEQGQYEGRISIPEDKEVINKSWLDDLADVDMLLIKRNFDELYYLDTNPDIKESGIDAFLHYFNYGWKEGRKPNSWFCPKFYLYKNKDVKDIEPLYHYLTVGRDEGRVFENYVESVNNDSFKYLKENTDYVPYKENEKINTELKTIAFYLPQFHPFKENDEWWGKGFTEWTNVSKAMPNFIGHYQPHLPIHNGFYDLRVPEVMIEQAKLAKNYGITGFNFYYYWFDGKILMHRPFEILLENKEIDIEFCLTWANENWSRRWDGDENDILISQNHSIEDSVLFIENMYKFFHDERYIKIDNKPVLIIYRADIIPNINEIANIWRDKVKEQGFKDLYLICSQTFGIKSPVEFGFDAAMEFPPHTSYSEVINHKVDLLNRDFEGQIKDYNRVVECALKTEEPEYKLFRTSMLSWDNTARKQNNPTIFNNFNIEAYKDWLSHNANVVLNNDKYEKNEKLMFINAWNEWAEGTHLEPDRKFGYGYLEATYESIDTKKKSNKNIVYVCHDAFFSGAQLLSLNIIKTLSQKFNYNVHMILKSGGELESEFKKYALVYNLQADYPDLDDLKKLISRLKTKGINSAICNTVVTGDVLHELSIQGIKTISLIHELPKLIKKYGMEGNANLICQSADAIVFPSKFVSDKFSTIADLQDEKTIISPQGLYQVNKYQDKLIDARRELRESLGLKSSSKVILGTGYGDFRKGIDIFAQVAQKVQSKLEDVYFVWVGNICPEMMSVLRDKYSEAVEYIIFVAAKPEISMYYSGADLYLMTSREDPFPSVVLEALNAKVPVIGFENAGGFQDVINDDTGLLVQYENVELMTQAVFKLIQNENLINKLGENGHKLIKEKFQWNNYIYKILSFLGKTYKKVSVIVPNYNYEKYIHERLATIEDQTYPIYELIYLEDCSTDKSLEIAKKFKSNTKLDMRIIENTSNSGSVFKQWLKGFEEASGDYIWIAEADDLANNVFLEEVMRGFDDPSVVLSYTQSKQIDEKGSVTQNDYLGYTNEIDSKKWLTNYTNDGLKELSEALVVKNTIPNVSAVVFKKVDISDYLDKLLSFKVAGDLYFYVQILKCGSIYFCSKSLNSHRRHFESVTVDKKNNQKHFDEIVQMQDEIMNMCSLEPRVEEIVFKYRQTVMDYLLGAV